MIHHHLNAPLLALQTKQLKMANTIRSIFQKAYPFRVTMMEYLNATDLATFCYAIGANLTSREREKYLLPIRDLPKQEQWTKSLIAHGNRLTIVGKDTPLWFAKVRHPREYWWSRKSHVTIRVWLGIPPNARDVYVRLGSNRLRRFSLTIGLET